MEHIASRNARVEACEEAFEDAIARQFCCGSAVAIRHRELDGSVVARMLAQRASARREALRDSIARRRSVVARGIRILSCDGIVGQSPASRPRRPSPIANETCERGGTPSSASGLVPAMPLPGGPAERRY